MAEQMSKKEELACLPEMKTRDRWVLPGGILMVGLIGPLMGSWFEGEPFIEARNNIILTLSATTFLWLGCRYLISLLWKKLPWHQFPVWHLILEVALIIIYSFFVVGLMYVVIKQWFVFLLPPDFSFLEACLSSAGVSLIISFIHEGVIFFQLWKFNFTRAQRLEKESLLSQFETLRNQVNPHFLFNSFNTLISLIEEDKDTAIQYVQKLSDFFRTILHLRERSVIPIGEELNLIQDYFFIQQKRYGDNLRIEIEIPPGLKAGFIPPLTLQMLAENAIKHNIISTLQPLKIVIESDRKDYIVVRNNLQPRKEKEPSAGIGLENIRHRFGFLTNKEVIVTASPLFFSVAVPVLYV